MTTMTMMTTMMTMMTTMMTHDNDHDDHDDHEEHSTETPPLNDSDHDDEFHDLTRKEWDILVRKDVAEVLNVTLSRVVVASLKQAPASAVTNGIFLQCCYTINIQQNGTLIKIL